MGRPVSRSALVAAGMLALTAATFAAVPAGAATSARVHVRAVDSRQAVPAAYPTSDIKGQGSTAIFKPSALTVSEDTSGGNCGESDPPISFVIKNTGTKSAYLTLGSFALGKIPAGAKDPVCIAGGGAGSTATFGLSNKANTVRYRATLKVTASD